MITLESWPIGQDFLFMNTAGRLYRVINALSIDVALGAACCAGWFATGFHVQLRPYAFFVLALTVWIIYTADHLMDAINIRKAASTYRHRFHQEHFKTFLMCVILAVILDLIFLFFVRLRILYAGLGLSAIVLLYLLVNRWLSFVKELVIACVYCLGVLLPVLALRGLPVSATELVWVASFFLTALINLIIFSAYDLQPDKADGYNSFVLTFGLTVTKRVLTILFFVQAMLIGGLLWARVWPAAGVLLAMNGVLFFLFFKPSYFVRPDAYRLYGDAIFMFPVVLLFVG